MKCPHCQVEIHEQVDGAVMLGIDPDGGWAVETRTCPACKRLVVYFLTANNAGALANLVGAASNNHLPINHSIVKRILARPRGATRTPCPAEVPPELAEDYNEACLVLPDSPKASAALSRRCLQNVLREAAGVTHSDLSKEIQEVISISKLPSHLSESLDAVRHIGNFAAHPIKSQQTGAVLPVEPGEAEWTLDVLEGLFDFYYVQPEVMKRRKAALNLKLSEAGKKTIP
jgi:hypothetical protein